MIRNQAGSQQSEINENDNDDNCLDNGNGKLYRKRECIYSIVIRESKVLITTWRQKSKSLQSVLLFPYKHKFLGPFYL
jgi:hypothetical protein